MDFDKELRAEGSSLFLLILLSHAYTVFFLSAGCGNKAPSKKRAVLATYQSYWHIDRGLPGLKTMRNKFLWFINSQSL